MSGWIETVLNLVTVLGKCQVSWEVNKNSGVPSGWDHATQLWNPKCRLSVCFKGHASKTSKQQSTAL